MSLTKEELKTALINHGLSPPPASAKKEEFLAMYEKHVAPIDAEAGEFSSDDEVTFSPKKKTSQSSAKSRASSKSPKKASKKMVEVLEENSLIAGDLDVDELDDDKLFQLLQENGISAGPIVDSTRPFYKKKLALVLRGESGVLNRSNGHVDAFSDTEPEEEVEDDQPSGTTSPQVIQEAPSTTRSSRGSAKSSRTAALDSSSLSDIKTGLRKRLNISDELDSSLSRNTPTPRRSIHTYKVSETTMQTMVLDKSGIERRDTVHTVERTESKGDGRSDSKPSLFSLKKLLICLLVLLMLCVAAYYLSTRQSGGGMSVESIMASVEKSIKGKPEQQAAPEPSAPEEPVPAPHKDPVTEL